MSYLEHRPDHCKTAQDVREIAYKVELLRIKSRVSRPKRLPPKCPQPIVRDWIFVGTPHLRITKFPPDFPERIKKIVGDKFLININEIDSQRRHKSLIIPRHTAFYLLKELTSKSFPEIGRIFGGRDHSTILHGVRKTQNRMNLDQAFKSLVLELRAKAENEIEKWRDTTSGVCSAI